MFCKIYVLKFLIVYFCKYDLEKPFSDKNKRNNNNSNGSKH